MLGVINSPLLVRIHRHALTKPAGKFPANRGFLKENRGIWTVMFLVCSQQGSLSRKGQGPPAKILRARLLLMARRLWPGLSRLVPGIVGTPAKPSRVLAEGRPPARR